MAINHTVIYRLLKKQHLSDIINEIITKQYGGNRKQFSDEHGVDLIALSRSLGVMDKFSAKPGLYVFTADQVRKIKLYVETLERLIE